MKALHSLVHSLAKEEKRLYNLHGRKGRFTHIYEGYLQAAEYDKQLDRDIYARHFSSFSRAFYSMQKNALMEDLLAVLLEYSNSSDPRFVYVRMRSKGEILANKEFHDTSLGFYRNAIQAAEEAGDLKHLLQVYDDYLDAWCSSEEANWTDYQQIRSRMGDIREQIAGNHAGEEVWQELKVLISNAKADPDNRDFYKEEANKSLLKLAPNGNGHAEKQLDEYRLKCEFRYNEFFEDPIEFHKKLIRYEKLSGENPTPLPLRMEIVNRLMESSMKCGDFLLISGLIYKFRKEYRTLPQEVRNKYQPRYLELAAIYHFYENELQSAQEELSELLGIESLNEQVRIRAHYHRASVFIAANLPRSAQDDLKTIARISAEEKNTVYFRLLEIVTAVERNQKEDALSLIQKMRTFLRKSIDRKEAGHLRNFLNMVQNMLNRKKVRFQEIPQFTTDWDELLKLNLWLKAKIENAFYFNSILEYWQERKKIVKV